MTEPQKPIRGVYLFFLTFALGLGTFIQVLDTSIANVSIPSISGILGASTTQGAWVITAFSVSNAIVLPLTGWLAKRIGQVRLFVWSTFLFSIASWLCGLSQTLGELIFFRVIQGAVAGSLIPLSQALLVNNYPTDKKGLALSFWAMIVIVAPIVGPILGGWITDNYGWEWIFYINIPLGFISSIATFRLLKGRETPKEKSRVDYVGFILMTLGIGSLQILLEQGNQLDWFSSNIIILLAIITVIALTYFIIWEKTDTAPVVDLNLFKKRNFRNATIVACIGMFTFFGGMVSTPLWLQNNQGYTPFWAGVAIAPIGFFSLIITPIIGKYMQRLDLRMVVTFSFAVFAITFFWFSTFTTQVTINDILFSRLMQGLGLSCFFVPLVAIALSEISPAEFASASGIFNFLRLLCGAGFGTALSINLWDRRTIYHHSNLASVLDETRLAPYSPINIYQTTGADQLLAAAKLDDLVINQAAMLALNDVFYAFAWLSLIAIPFLWFTKPPFVKGGVSHHVAAH